MTYRQLTTEEINRLLLQYCSAENWENISVAENFTVENIVNTRFEGKIKLGVFTGKLEVDKNELLNCGLYNSTISNCEIAGKVRISDVRRLSNYNIDEDVVISNVGSLAVTGESYFGNGTEIEVLNEGGGRELPIFDRLSSQVAYLTVMYRHDHDFSVRMLRLISDYCRTKRSDRGIIGRGSRIIDSISIKNVLVGSFCRICGASLLEEGTIRSCREAPVFIGSGVIARKFIILSGSTVDEGAILDKSFVGQGVKMGRQFSAENSVFFANSEAFHSEACSLFAGPYSVTHHKSTLLIASLVSFFNAGSGTNQSNHMYKLGPVHQGIFERGSKTGSFSYLLLPCRVGAYSVVMGKHYVNFDASDFPFSYIAEEKGKSELTPAMNFFTVGTRRDIDKWPSRDRRTDPEKMDRIHFDMLNPYIAGKILGAIEILNELAEKTDKKLDYANYKGININRLLLKATRKYYEMALKIYIGQEIIKRLKGLNSTSSASDLKNLLTPQGDIGIGRWVDLCGLFSPESQIVSLMESVKSGAVGTIDKLDDKLADIYNGYEKFNWVWCARLISRMNGDSPENLSKGSLIQIIDDWRINAVKLNNMVLKDAEKEFDPGSRIGFGIDGDNDLRDKDFEAVRGDFNKNKFVTTLQKESGEIENKANELKGILELLM